MRQPKNDKCYSVEVSKVVNARLAGGLICGDSEVYAASPADAVVYALRKVGYDVSRKNIIKNPVGDTTVARVCLLGGTRESVTYFGVLHI